MKPDDLYTKVWPDYFETQRKDLFWYERLWTVLLRQLEKRAHWRGLIEFGSGPGFLLVLARKRGWFSFGEEPSEVARRHAEGLGAFSATPGHFVHSRFGAAIATEVLEHVEDPEATLRKWGSVLERGHPLALSVPNDNNPLQRLFGRLLAPRNGDRGGLVQCEDQNRPWIHHTHKSYFNPRSLRRLVESAGFKVVWTRTSFPVELLLVLPIPRKWAWKLSRVWPAPPFLWRFNIGRHVLMVAKKA